MSNSSKIVIGVLIFLFGLMTGVAAGMPLAMWWESRTIEARIERLAQEQAQRVAQQCAAACQGAAAGAAPAIGQATDLLDRLLSGAGAPQYPPPTAVSDGVTEFHLPRSEFEAGLRDQSALMRSVRILPGPDGVRLFGIRRTSIASTAGFRNGDTVVSINGTDLRSPENALELFASARALSSFDCVIIRHGERIRQRVVID